MKKNLQSVTGKLQSLAATQPTQHVAPPVAAPPALSVVAQVAKPASQPASDPQTQVNFWLRRSQKRQLDQLAAAADMPVKAFILLALQAKGLEVSEGDLTDRRKKQG